MKKSVYNWCIFLFIWHFAAVAEAQEMQVDSVIPPEEVLLNKAKILVDSSKNKEAILLLKKAIKVKPDYWEAYNEMALAKIKLKDHKGAGKDLAKAEEIAPLNYETSKLKGINYFLTQQYNDAKVMFDTALYILTEEKIDDYELYYYRAQLMFLGKSYKEGLENCEIAIDMRPVSPEIYLLKGKIRFAAKEYKYALRELNTAIDQMNEFTKDYEAYKLRARSKFEIGDYKGAVADWDVYLEGMGNGEEALISRAAAKININDNSGAIVDLDEAIKINNKNPVSYCYRGVAKGGNKQYLEALKDLDYSIKLKFDYPAAYVNRAAIKMATKDKRGACADLEKADGLGDEMAMRLVEQYCKDNRR